MKLLHCVFNIGNARMELRFEDGTEISIYISGIDNEICTTMPMQVVIDWLIYNEPLIYAKLVFTGELAGMPEKWLDHTDWKIKEHVIISFYGSEIRVAVS